jgi:hypothetical protein
MERRDEDIEAFFNRCRAALSGPVPCFSGPESPVEDRIRKDGFSLPVIATGLRRWAQGRADVLKVVMGCTPKKYYVAVLASSGDVLTASNVEKGLAPVLESFGSEVVEVYVLGPAYENADVFRRYGTYGVYPEAAKAAA